MLKEELAKLPPDDYKVLMYAFENDFSQIVRLSKDRFIGVNIKLVDTMLILETKGSFTYGEFKCF